MRLHIILSVLVAVLTLTHVGNTQIPRTISYQGVLADSGGTPKSNGTYGAKFRLYTISSGGSPIWLESKSISVKRGLFSTILGDVIPFPDSVKFDRVYWLAIQIGLDLELTPRTPMTSVGYSFSSIRSDASTFADSARSAGAVANNSITSVNIQSGQVVKSLNGIHDVVILQAQGGATLTSNGDTITINSGSGGGGTGIQGVQNTNNTLDISNPNGPTATVNVKVPLSLSGNVTSTDAVVAVTNTSTTGLVHGIVGKTSSTVQNATGVYGEGLASSGYTSGVQGYATQSPLGTGVVGIGAANGGYFRSESGTGNGLMGISTSSIGVYGESNTNFGVFGRATGGTGVYGQGGSHGGSFSGTDFGVYGNGTTGIFGQGGTSYGVSGISTSGYAGVYGTGPANGVYGLTSSGTDAGVYGRNDGSDGNGVLGASINGNGVEGYSTGVNRSGVWGHNDRSDGIGVAGSSIGGKGVSGTSTNGDGVVGSSNAANKSGVWGHNDVILGVGVAGSSTNGIGVRGTSGSADAYAVYGSNSGTLTSGGIGWQTVYGGLTRPVGIYGATADAGRGIAILGLANSSGQFSNQYAGFFEGNVRVTADFSVGGDKNFMIDHPLDPVNKYLKHSCVESNDRMNIYNGNITTDANGEAAIEMPNWFEPLNIDFRYQLTILGDLFAQARISKKIHGNKFSIKTDKPNIEVSWQVTGIRNDAYAKAHPMQVEIEKPAHEKGTYTFPELYGLPPRTFEPVKSDEKK